MSLYKHNNPRSCIQKQELKRNRTKLDDFKSTLTVRDLQEIKQMKKENDSLTEMMKSQQEIMQKMQGTLIETKESYMKSQEEMKESQRELIERVDAALKEKESLRQTVINLSPTIVVFQSILHPIQCLDTLDWSDRRFRDVVALSYPHPNSGLALRSNGNSGVYRDKVRLLQSILPVSVQDEKGNVFYKDEDVLKMDEEDSVPLRILGSMQVHDSEARHALRQVSHADDSFREDILSNIRNAHVDSSSPRFQSLMSR
jgi:hypothetical protein